MVSPPEQTKALSKRLGDWLRYASVQQGAAHASGGFFSTPRARQVSLGGGGGVGRPVLGPPAGCRQLLLRDHRPGPKMTPPVSTRALRAWCLGPALSLCCAHDAVRSLGSCWWGSGAGPCRSPSACVLASYEGALAVLDPAVLADLPCPLQPGPVTEVDGTVATDFFTVLSTGQRFTEDQRLNVQAFSMLRAWLLQGGPARPGAADAGGTGRAPGRLGQASWAPGCFSQTC